MSFVLTHKGINKRVHERKSGLFSNLIYIVMSDYFSLLQNVTTEAGTFKTFSVFPAKRDYKYGFFCFGAEDKFVTLCAFNEKEDVDFVFGDSYSDLIATGVGERIRFVEYIWLRIW